ncbi:MAG: riboflavin biosynthesis protein RibF [bacterium]
MIRIGNGEAPPPQIGRPVVTVGMFDGVHRGHQRVLADLEGWADELDTAALVVTFDRHPRAMAHGETVPFITSPEHRMVLFERLGVDACAVLTFDEQVRRMPPREFVVEVICGRFQAQGMLLGYNGRFGRDAEGDYELLRRLEAEGVCLARQSAEPVTVDGRPVSSSAIRGAIESGDLARARRMLGRPVSVLGTVSRGERRGSRLGFPTANLDLHHEVKPPAGVYVTRARVGGAWRPALTSIGRKPTFPDPPAEDVVEVFVPDLDRPLYGESVEVRFDRKIREQIAFPSAEELAAQIAQDLELLRGGE